MDRIQLLDNLDKKFSDNDLRRLGFTLNIDYESLPSQGKAAKALHCGRLERFSELVAAVQQARPHLNTPPLTDAITPSIGTIFDMRGQHVENQTNIAGNYYAGSANDPAIHAKLDKLLAGQDNLKSVQSQLLLKLDESERKTVKAIIGQLRAMQTYETDSDTELKALLDDLRRGILFINAQQLPQISAGLRKTLAAVNETLTAGTDLRTGLELTMPLIPFLVEYKIDLSGAAGLDLRQIWERMQAWLDKHKP